MADLGEVILFCSFFHLKSEAGAIKCQLSYVVLPVLDIRAAREVGAARKPKAKSRAKAGAKAKRRRPCVKGAQPARVVYKEWPVFSPEHMCRAIFEAGRWELMMLACMVNEHVFTYFFLFFAALFCFVPVETHPRTGNFDWSDFWVRARSERWGERPGMFLWFLRHSHFAPHQVLGVLKIGDLHIGGFPCGSL